MGTCTWFAAPFAKNRGSGAGTVFSGDIFASGQTTTSTSSNGLDSGTTATTTEVTFPTGFVLRVRMDEDAWLKTGGVTPSVGDGIFLPSGENVDIEITTAGKVNVIDAA